MKRFFLPLLALALLGGLVPVRALTESEAKAGRAIVKRYADAVVSVELVVSMDVSMNGHSLPSRETRRATSGTVVSPAGLTVAALSSLDPHSEMDRVRAAVRSAVGAAAHSMTLGEAQFKEVKLRLGDGTEVPARMVLKDPDNDLAFIAPEAGAAPGRVFFAVDLSKEAKAEVLAPYFDISRSSKELQRIPMVDATTIGGIVERPRRLYLLTIESIGCPVFNGQGDVLGICVRYINNGEAVRSMVMPAGQVAEIAKQAAVAAAKPPAEPAPASDDANADDAPAAPAKPAAVPKPASKS